MKLTEDQLSVIKEVRDLMYADAEADHRIDSVSFYICSNIQNVVFKRANGGFPGNRERELMDSLCNMIHHALSRYTTFGSYIHSYLVGRGHIEDIGYVSLGTIVLGRLAWLDKILDSGEIAAETLPITATRYDFG